MIEAAALLSPIFRMEIGPQDLFRNVCPPVGQTATFAVGAHSGNELVGVVFFIGHDFLRGGRVVPSYQASWGAVSSRYMGGRIFQKALTAGVEFAQRRGGELVFGFPNNLSEGVMTHGAGFTNAGKFRRLVIPRFLTRVPSLFLRRGPNAWLAAEAVEQNNAQLFEWKRADRGPQIIRVACGGNCLWGRLQLKRIGGRNLSTLRVGGMLIPRLDVLPYLLRTALRETGADVLDLMFQSMSEFSRFLRFHHFAQKSEGLLVLPLVSDLELGNFDLWVGAKDTF
jgi:hypothetical protein